jgi:hypothetical protein
MRKIQPNKLFHLVCFLLATLFVATLATSAAAQGPAHYYPAKPTFSTYLLYRQLNTTGIPNYYQYVRPASQFRDFTDRTPAAIGAEARRQTLTVEQQVAIVLENELRTRATTGIGQPSVPAQFNDTSHFFPRPDIRRRR